MPPESRAERQQGSEIADALPMVEPRPRAAIPAVPPGAPWFFAAGMAVALAVAATAGSSLAVIAALDPAWAPANLSAIIQGHGRIQLFSFAAVFVLALTFEFIVRFNGRPALPLALRLTTLALVGTGALAVAIGQFGEGAADGLMVSGAALGLTGALMALGIAAFTRPPHPMPFDVPRLYFGAAAAWLTIASSLTLAGAFDAVNGLYQGGDARAINEVLLRGFVLNTILAVALRAIPGHLGVPALLRGQQIAAFAVLNLAVAVWLLGSGAALFSWSPALMRAGDVLLALVLIAYTWKSHILRAFVPPGHGHPPYQTLVPLAWLGAVAYALALIGFSFSGLVPNATAYQQGAVRHIFMLGFMLPLMLAFAHIVLARFGTGTFPGQQWLILAFAAVFVAWPLRVVPALFPGAQYDTLGYIMAMSGVLVAFGLAVAAAVCGATAYRIWVGQRLRVAAVRG